MFKSRTREIVFTQYEHGRLAGTVARAWGNDTFDRPALDFDAQFFGFVAGVMEFIGSLQGGDLSIALPAGVGISGWAIGRGLLRGNRRAWRWARRIAALVMVASALVGAVALFADADTMTLDFPWGTRDAGKREAILLLGVMAFIGAWQFFSLSSGRDLGQLIQGNRV